MAGYQGYMVYLADGTTITVGFPQPVSAVLERVARGVFASGVERVALGRKLTWTYDSQLAGLSEAELLIVTAARPASGKVTIATWWPPEGATAAHWADCSAIWSPFSAVANYRGRYIGLALEFSDVRHL